MPFATTWTDLEDVMLSKKKKKKKPERQILHHFTYMWSIKKRKQSKQNKTPDSDTENRLVVAKVG